VEFDLQTRGVAFTSQMVPAVEQSTHFTPPEPHCPSRKPSWHTPEASQQPSAHVLALHGGFGGVQTEEVQMSPVALQLMHDLPPVPQAKAAVPDVQLPSASQQPLHVAGPHATFTHTPPWHCSPDAAQSVHAVPPPPHAPACVPCAHTPFTQHPAHVVGPQVASQ
jgi:hypothetical protein